MPETDIEDKMAVKSDKQERVVEMAEMNNISWEIRKRRWNW